MEGADAIAFGAICGLVEALRNTATTDDLCEDHQHKLGLLDSTGAFDPRKPSKKGN